MKNEGRKPLFSVTKADCKWDNYEEAGSKCVKCTHTASGAIGKSEENQSQSENEQAAFRYMAESPEFKAWVKLETANLSGQEGELEEVTEQSIHQKIDVKSEKGSWEDGLWVADLDQE